MNNKSTPIIALGLAVFVVGGALLLLLLRGSDHKTVKPVATPAVVPTTTAPPPGSAASVAAAAATPIKIPAGQNAIAVQVDYFAGIGGFARSGDVVNIYEVVNKDCKDTKGAPLGVKLALPNVRVLQVLESPPGLTGQSGNYLLAMSPQEAERLIFLKTGFGIYFALANQGDPVPATSGVSCSNGL